MRLEHKFYVTSKKTGETRGPFYCPFGKTWNALRVEEQAVCAQSSFTIFKKLDAEKVLSPEVSEPTNAKLSDDDARQPDGDDLRRILASPRRADQDDIL